MDLSILDYLAIFQIMFLRIFVIEYTWQAKWSKWRLVPGQVFRDLPGKHYGSDLSIWLVYKDAELMILYIIRCNWETFCFQIMLRLHARSQNPHEGIDLLSFTTASAVKDCNLERTWNKKHLRRSDNPEEEGQWIVPYFAGKSLRDLPSRNQTWLAGHFTI